MNDLSPERGWREPVLIDYTEILRFHEIVHEHVGELAKRLPEGVDKGRLQIVAIHPDKSWPDNITSRSFAIGEIKPMCRYAADCAARGWNVYIETRTVRNERRKGRGGIDATAFSFALVVDVDRDKPDSGDALEVMPSLRVESSPGNEHQWLFFSRAWPADLAKQLGKRLKKKVGATDDCTGCVTTPFRVAGTPRYPDAAKRARGRRISSTHILSHSDKLWTPDELYVAFPELVAVRKSAAIDNGEIKDETVKRILRALAWVPNDPPVSHYIWLKTLAACAYAAERASPRHAARIKWMCRAWSNTAKRSRLAKRDDNDVQFNRAWNDAIDKNVGVTLGSLYYAEKIGIAWWLKAVEDKDNIRAYLKSMGLHHG